MSKITIALDVMGGDNAPASVIEGINIFLEDKSLDHSQLQLLLFGDESRVRSCGASLSAKAKEVCKFINVSGKVLDTWKVAEALRKGKGTSMWEAVQSVASNQANAVVSAGNTGALMAISKVVLKMLPGINRPAIIAMLPSGVEGRTLIMLDLGANTTATAENLVQFAVMGDAYCRLVAKVRKPKIALLNIGSEDIKGHMSIRQAGLQLEQLASQKTLDYVGFIEGNHLFSGVAEVIVTDGFSGNIGLKIIEGTSKYILDMIKGSIKRSILAKLGLMFLLPIALKLKRKVDYRRYNGAMLIGLNGICVKAHGVSDKAAMANAISNAYKLAFGKVNSKIQEDIKHLDLTTEPSEDIS